ncbi:hypothetical protein MMPV_001028 [Pyropia vietnamensis]
MANMGGPVEGAAAPEGETAVSLARVLGPLPSFDQISAWEGPALRSYAALVGKRRGPLRGPDRAPPVVTYFRDLLIDGNAFAWAVFITEWTATTGAFLVDEYRRSSRLWLYPRRLAGWIRQLDSRHFCRGPDGLDEVAERELRALLNLLDTLNEEPGLHHRLAQLAWSERERAGWVRVGLVTEGDKTEARVAGDLSPLEIPYTEDVLRHRTFAVPPHRPAEAGPAVSALRGPL